MREERYVHIIDNKKPAFKNLVSKTKTHKQNVSEVEEFSFQIKLKAIRISCLSRVKEM